MAVALDFPNSPAIGDTWPNPPQTGVPTYKWDGIDWLAAFALGKEMVPLDGSTAMTGLLTLSGPPTADLNAATKKYVDDRLVPRSYLAGLTLSVTGSSSFTVAPGMATDNNNSNVLTLNTALIKNTASWTVGAGNGALDTGAISPNTWYHVHLIKRTDTNVVEALLSLSATAPTLPSGYTLSRRIGSMKTDASSLWVGFLQIGDQFRWKLPLRDFTASNPGTAAITRMLTVPTGIVVEVDIVALVANFTSSAIYFIFSSLAEPDNDPTSLFNFGVYNTGNQNTTPFLGLLTNTSAQIRIRMSASAGSDTLIINTYGWFDRRGRDN